MYDSIEWKYENPELMHQKCSLKNVLHVQCFVFNLLEQ